MAQFGLQSTHPSDHPLLGRKQQPVISVRTPKKKGKLVGGFSVTTGANIGPKANPEEVRVHDFLIKELGPRRWPYGVYDLAANSGWVSVGVDHDNGRLPR